MTLILFCKACLIALAWLLALATLAVAVILGIAYWIAKGEYSLGAEADASGLCSCPDCRNHDGTGLDCHASASPRLRASA